MRTYANFASENTCTMGTGRLVARNRAESEPICKWKICWRSRMHCRRPRRYVAMPLPHFISNCAFRRLFILCQVLELWFLHTICSFNSTIFFLFASFIWVLLWYVVVSIDIRAHTRVIRFTRGSQRTQANTFAMPDTGFSSSTALHPI